MEDPPDAPTRQIRSPPPWAESDSLSRPTSFPDRRLLVELVYQARLPLLAI